MGRGHLRPAALSHDTGAQRRRQAGSRRKKGEPPFLSAWPTAPISVPDQGHDAAALLDPVL